MMRIMLKSKLHRLTVTETHLDYEGSIAIDKALLAKADIIPGERVQIVNIDNGQRFETYAIPGGAGKVSLNGGAARLGSKGDRIIVIAYAIMNDKEAKKIRPNVILVDERNKIKR